MIAHRINRERKASSPARLIKYMVAAKGGIDPTSWERTADYILDSANGTTRARRSPATALPTAARMIRQMPQS